MPLNIYPCSGRETVTHQEFTHEFYRIRSMRILTLDVGHGSLPYWSKSNDLVFCSNERYHLDVHKFLTIAPAHKYIRDVWTKKLNNGQDWKLRGKFISPYSNSFRPKVLRNWDDVATYYCLLCMSNFNVSFRKWKMIGEHTPHTPRYGEIRDWYRMHKDKSIRFYRSNIYNFPTTEIDDNTLIYLHLPNNFAMYGCGYAWTKRKLEYISRELTQLARLGFPVCVSALYEQRGRKVILPYADYFPSDTFSTYYMTELKAKSKYYAKSFIPRVETYFYANIEPGLPVDGSSPTNKRIWVWGSPTPPERR